MKNIRAFNVILLLLLFCKTDVSAISFNYRIYNKSDGLPSTYINSIAQDSLGRMWFATKDGVMIYDGTNWEMADLPEQHKFANFDGLRILSNNDIFLFKNPHLSILHFGNGIWEEIHSPFTSVTPGESVFAHEVFEMDGELLIFLSIGSSLFQYSGATWTKLECEDDLAGIIIYQILLYENEPVFLSNHGMLHLNNQTITRHEKMNQIFQGETILAMVQTKPESSTWLIISPAWIGKLKNDHIEKLDYKISDSFLNLINTSHDNPITACELPSLGFLLGTKNSLILLSPKMPPRFLARDLGFPGYGITDLYRDFEGNIWLSSPRGLVKIPRSVFINFTAADGLLESEVTSIVEAEGNLYLGHNFGFSIMSGNNISKVKLVEHDFPITTDNRILHMARDSRNNVWAASSESGLIQISGKSVSRFPMPDNDLCVSICNYVDDTLLVGGRLGLFKFKNSIFTKISNGNFANSLIRDIEYQPDRGICIGQASAGVSRKLGEHWEHFFSKSGTANNVYKIVFLDTTILLGLNTGLFEFINDSVQKLDGPFSIDHSVYSILNDSRGRLWFGTDRGVYLWDREQFRHFTTKDGLAGDEANRDALIEDHAGNIWIGTNAGLSLFKDKYDIKTNPPPFIYIQSVQTSSKKINSLNEKVTLPFKSNDLSFQYSANSFIDEDRVFVRYQLVGYDDDWQPEISSHNQTIRYTNLPPGDYQFQIKARFADGEYSPQVTTKQLTVLPPFWRRWWFFSICVLGVFILGAIIQFNFQNLHQSQILEQHVVERTAELENSKNSYQKLLETAVDPIVEFDRNGIILSCNSATEQIYGYDRFDLIGINIDILFNKTKSYDDFWREIERYKGGGKNLVVGSSVEQTGITSTGEELDLLFSTSTRLISDKETFILFIKDISPQKRLESQLRNTLRLLRNQKESLKQISLESIRIQEIERKRISNDLHDQIGQSLTALNLSLELLANQKITSQEIPDTIKRCQSIVERTTDDIHRFCFELRPTIIDDLGLMHAIRENIQSYSTMTKHHFLIDGKIDEGMIPPGYAIIIYRIYQESIQNIMKHAKATEIKISFKNTKQQLTMIISDNGIGMDPDKLSVNTPAALGGLGIIGMQERARYVGGSLLLDSTLNVGTTIILNLPLT